MYVHNIVSGYGCCFIKNITRNAVHKNWQFTSDDNYTNLNGFKHVLTEDKVLTNCSDLTLDAEWMPVGKMTGMAWPPVAIQRTLLVVCPYPDVLQKLITVMLDSQRWQHLNSAYGEISLLYWTLLTAACLPQNVTAILASEDSQCKGSDTFCHKSITKNPWCSPSDSAGRRLERHKPTQKLCTNHIQHQEVKEVTR